MAGQGMHDVLHIAGPAQVLVLLAVGLGSGLVGGMVGVGGSVIMIPAMWLLLGPHQHIYQAAAMVVNVLVAAAGAWQHYRAGAVLVRVVRAMVAGGVAGVVIGVFLSERRLFHGRGEFILSGIFGVFLVYVAGYNAWRLWALRGSAGRREPPEDVGLWRAAVGVGLPAGVLAGLLGIGGGAVAVPLQQILLRMPFRYAVGNSITTIIFVAAVGAICKNGAMIAGGVRAGEIATLAGVLAPMAVIGSLAGARLTDRLPLAWVRGVFVAIVLLVAIRMIRAGLAVIT